MFNFLANCPHLPNFSNLFGASQSEDEIQSYANFGFPEGVSNSESTDNSSSHGATTASATNYNSDTGAVSPSALSQVQNTEQGSLCEVTPEDEGPWFYIPSGPFCDTQKKNIALAKQTESKQSSTVNPEEDVLCISGLADLRMPADTSPSLRSLHKVMDRAWVRFPEA